MSDFRSGHELMEHRFEPHTGLSAVSAEPTSDPLSPFLSAPPPLKLSLKNKYLKKRNAYFIYWGEGAERKSANPKQALHCPRKA